ncbi:MAG: Sapep family Mn(2+)-dependent dipeptidase [Clostridia bacterium]|nr:Sapep family Mn(2+)-dependent dipeptidase [Clostridia bacterium]
MNKQVDQWIDAHKDTLVCALQDIIRFPSVSGAAAPDAPFGKPVREALDYALSLCEGFGFDVCDLDGYMGYADCGEGAETLGVLTHLDVVPAGDGWTHDPYGASIADGRIYGRGTLDDKGPAIAAIFALAAIKSCGLPFTRKVRLMMGCDEECGMGCMKYYIENRPLPDLAFSPDADYPLVNSEKGIFHCSYTKKFPSAIRLNAGTVVNAVPDKATAFVPIPLADVIPLADAFSAKEGFPCTLDSTQGGTSISLAGVGAHASMPEDGQNALLGMLALLSTLPLGDADAAAVQALHNTFRFDRHGETIGIDCTDESGRLTCNPGLMQWDSEGYTICIDIRYPITMDNDLLLAKLDAAIAGARSDTMFKAGHFVPEDSELVQKLLAVYEARSGQYLPPKRIGGGTYARCIGNAVAFGPEIPGGDNRIHMADEFMSVDDLVYHTKMIADAMIALATNNE